MVSILFATNRRQKAGSGLPDFGDEPCRKTRAA